MIKTKSFLGIVFLTVLALLFTACAKPSPVPQPSPTPPPIEELAVKDAVDARDAALKYLREHYEQNVPSEDSSWQEEDVTPPGFVGSANKYFTSSEWIIGVSYPVVRPDLTVYKVVLSSVKLGWHWKGTVKADGTVTEVSPLKQMTEEESRKFAEDFVRNSPTFTFDGIENTLKLVNTLRPRCPYCWVFIFEFDSAHAGYGDRTGQVLAEVITHHEASIAVEQLTVTSAVMDGKWDMILQEMTGSQPGKPEGSLSVAELLAKPVYDIEVTIYGEVSLLGELLCPCFELGSGGEKVQVWYDLMVENDGAERSAVSVEGINNGEKIIVTGELKGEGGTHYSKGDFWAKAIVPLQLLAKATVEVSCGEFMQDQHIHKTVEAGLGQMFEVVLCSNPSTGFQWSETAQISDQNMLEQTDHKLVMPKSEPPPPPGTAGQEVWIFKAVKKGTTEVSMEYSRPWEGGEKGEWTFTLTVTVK